MWWTIESPKGEICRWDSCNSNVPGTMRMATYGTFANALVNV